MHRTTMNRSKWSYQKYYEGVLKAQSSIERREQRRMNQNSLTKPQSRIVHDRPIQTFKKELNRKQLTKTKIKLDAPYDRHSGVKSRAQEESMGWREERSAPGNSLLYENVRNKLLSLKREDREPLNSTQKSQDMQRILSGLKSHSSEKNLTADLREVPQGMSGSTQKLLAELSRRDQVYRVVQEGLGKREESDTAISLQQHFRQHQLMVQILQEFKEVCGIEASIGYAQLNQYLSDESRLSSESSVIQALSPPR